MRSEWTALKCYGVFSQPLLPLLVVVFVNFVRRLVIRGCGTPSPRPHECRSCIEPQSIGSH